MIEIFKENNLKGGLVREVLLVVVALFFLHQSGFEITNLFDPNYVAEYIYRGLELIKNGWSILWEYPKEIYQKVSAEL